MEVQVVVVVLQELLVCNHKLLTDSRPQYLFGTSPFLALEEVEPLAQEVAEEEVAAEVEAAEDHTPTLVEQAHLELAQELEAQVNTLTQA